ncbi:MAG TPA: histidine kinase, partial [Ktedonobacterales bacterium]
MKVSHVAQPSPREVTWWLKLRLVRRVLLLPLLYRVLIANGVVILLGATIGTSLATQLRDTARPVILVLFVLTGLLASVAINWVLLKLMLFPLSQVREMMEQVQRGDLRRKAPVTGQDPDADALAEAFNTMVTALDDLGRSRASQILQAQEQERKRIARELHDETSQVLTTLLISLRMLENSVQSDDARARVAETRALAHQTLRAVRSLSIDLRPSALDEFGLVPALRSYVKWYQENTDIAVDLCVNGLKDRLPPEMETALYRIVQEALTNTA